MPLQELDSRPLSEASSEALARKTKPKKKPMSYPDWKLCGRHGNLVFLPVRAMFGNPDALQRNMNRDEVVNRWLGFIAPSSQKEMLLV